MSDTKTPYDTLFRTAFEGAHTAKELTLFLVPDRYARRLAGANVTAEPELLVDDETRRRRNDLLLQFAWPRPAATGSSFHTSYLYVLYEHKSSPNRWVALQVLRYMAIIWQRLVGKSDEHLGGLLPEILPVVLYHGEEPWNEPLQLAELISGGAGSPHVPHYRPLFVDLTQIPDDRITGSLQAMLGLVALKHARLPLEQAATDLLTELLHRGEADPAVRHLARVVEQVYVNVKSAEEVERLMAAASRLGYPEVEGGYMTYAQEMLAKGRNEGLEQGSLQRSREVLIRLVDRKFGLTHAERQRIMGCEHQAALDEALDEFALAEDKAQVLARLT